MEKVIQNGEKSVFIERNTGTIQIHNPNGEIHILDPKTQEDITQLQKEFGERLSEILDALKDFTNAKIPRLLTNPPFNTDLFIGRENDLKTIEAQYQDHNRLLVLVNGEGGIGKTTLAAKYWYAHADRYKHLAWLYADAGIGAALVTLKGTLGVNFEQNDDFDAQIRRITEAINNLDTPCLLVFDNANNATDLKKYYTTLHQLPNCHILLTSRVSHVANMKVHKVLPLTETEAVSLFKCYYPALPDTELPLLHDVLKAVGYNTLVTEVLAKNMAVFNRFSLQYTLADLLHDLQAKGLLALKNKTVAVVYGSNILREAEPKDIIAAMYDLSSLNDAERYILSNFAVLPAENIAYTLLTTLLDANKEALETPLSSLEEKGWLEYLKTGNTFKISPVIQEVTRSKNAERLLNDCRTLVNTLITGLANDNRHIDNYQQAALFARLGSVVIYTLPIGVDLAILCHNIGNYHQDTGNLSLMLQVHQKMLDIQTALCVTEPDNAHFENILAISYSKLGDTHSSLGNLDKALGFFKIERKLFEKLYNAYPTNVSFKNGLAISYSKLGETHSSLGNLDKALDFFDIETKLFEELYDAYPTTVSFTNSLAISYEKLGDAHRSLGNLDKALGFFEIETKLFEKLYNAHPQNVSFKRSLAIAYENLGNTHSRLGTLDKALGFFEIETKLFEELYATYPQNVSFKNGLAISYEKLGVTHTLLGNLNKALEFFEQFNQLENELYTTYPQNVEFKNALAISYKNLGVFNRDDLKDNTKAKTYFQEAEKLWSELVRDAPQYVQFQQFLEMVQKDIKSLD
ncbi:MAG TPA: hypothetical protein DCR35_00475 [Runella sp.]|nr:hypothetical protein [Runella sp.]HAO47892.1 hypothetical protein [Runella sp.]